MNKFDYNIHRAVGIMTIDFSKNGHVEVCGYVDGTSFHHLNKDEAIEMFPPKGKIFAYNVGSKYEEWDGECISISVVPNISEGDGHDEFVWNKGNEIELEGYILNSIDEHFNENGENNYQILSKHALLDQEDTVYILSDEKIYKIDHDTDKRFIPYYRADKTFTSYSERRETYYLLDCNLGEEEDVIDITNDNQLVDWFTRKILKPNWAVIQESGTKEAQAAVRETLLSYKQLPLSIAESRYNRLSELIGAYRMTKDCIDNLKNFNWLVPTIENSISCLKDEYFKNIEEENQERISNINSEYDKRIQEKTAEYNFQLESLQEEFNTKRRELAENNENLDKFLAQKKDELEQIRSLIKDTQNTFDAEEKKLDLLQGRKEDIIKDFEVIREVMNLRHNGNKKVRCNLEAIDNNAQEAFHFFNEFQAILGCWLKGYGYDGALAINIGNLLSKYKIILVPDCDIVKSILMTTGKCTYMTSYVNVAWKSFDDLWESGLGALIEESRKNKDRLFYLVLRNINLTYLPNYLQPILDIQSGFCKRLPNETEDYPENLRILATATTDRVIPMTGSSLKYIGCPRKMEKGSESNIEKDKLMDKGYLNTKTLIEIASSVNANNNYEEYIDEDCSY